MQARMVSIGHGAEETGVSYSALRRWIKRGEFKYYVKSGNRYWINLDRLIEFLNTPITVTADEEER